MPVGVVVSFEPIDIDKQQRKHAAVSPGPSPFLVQDFTQRAAVMQARQTISSCQHGQLRFRTHTVPQLEPESKRQSNKSGSEHPYDSGDGQGAMPPCRIDIGIGFCHDDGER
ncbi:hypothetical protein SDC9_124003 [bioreactor metagenome]|uniref:Uncharacterized protein n=1 Tax=bioreactor metagenome TaxID=1076179 RepID=A0A645CJ83_9ZZZZ